MRCTSCSNEVKYVVAVDIDGTLATYHQNYTQFVEMYDDLAYGTLPREWSGIGEFRDLLGLTRKEHHERKLAFRAGGFKRWMDAFAYVNVINSFREAGLEVWMTTTRPWMRMDNVDTDTVEWLRRNGIEYDHLLFDEDKYGKLLELVDKDRIIAVLDDEAEQRDRCIELGLPFVLRQTRWNYGVGPRGRPLVKSLHEFVETVNFLRGLTDALQH